MIGKSVMEKSNVLLFIFLFLMASPGAFSEEITRDGAEMLLEKCMEQREELLAPEREEAVEWCIEKRRRSREYCESYHRTYGARRYRANGTWAPALYMDLPDCVKALEAQRYFRMNPSRGTYTAQ